MFAFLPANDPQIGPQMIVRPEMISASETAEKSSGVNSKKSLRIDTFFF